MRSQLTRPIYHYLTACAALLIACDSETSEPTPTPTAGTMVSAGAMGGAVGGAVGGAQGGGMAGVEVEPADTVYLTYNRVVTEGGETRADLIAFNMRAYDEVVLNEGIPLEEMDCLTYGCVLHPTLSWVAWIKRGAMAVNELWLAPVDKAGRRVDVSAKRKLSDAALTFSFTSTKLVFTEVKDSAAREGNAVKVVSLEDPSSAREVDLVSDLGGFSVTSADDLLIIIKATLSSMTVFFRNLANDQILELYTFGEAGGTGSEFSATSNPVRFSPDNTYVAAVTSNQLTWRLHSLDATGAAVEPVTHELFPSQTSPDACSGAYPFTSVLNEPRFSPDGQFIYVLFGGDCSQRENTSANRRDYDIYRFSRDVSAPPLNITHITRANHWSNHDLGAFDVTPDQRKVAFVATRPNKNGVKGIWLMDITEDPAAPVVFDCSRDPNMTPAYDINGERRCEFISVEVASGGTVEYRGLSFTQAGGL